MGQTMSTIVGYIIVFCLKLSERTKSIFSGEKKEKNYYSNDILLKDDEQQADILSSDEINKIIKKQQNMKKNTGNEVNMNEYKIIKNTIEMDESESLTDKSSTENSNNKEIQELQKEVINLHVQDDKEMDDEDEHSLENIEDLKASILNHD